MARKPEHETRNFEELEDQLAATLKPVRPGHIFVQNVRQRIGVAAPAVAIRPAPDVRSFLVIMTGVVSAVVVAAISARLIFFLRARAR
jgi:hypothetical protein